MNILLTSVGRRTYLVRYFKEALSGNGKVHASNSEPTLALQVADHSFISKLIHNENYIEQILNYCIKNNISAVIPLFDIDLPVLAKNKNKFLEQGIHVIVGDLEFIKTCNDKWLTYELLKENGFHVPQTFLSIELAQNSLAQNLVHFPIIIKPRWGMGSIGIYEADNDQELRILYKKTMNKIQNSYLKYELQGNTEFSVILQEKLQGDEYGLDIFNDLNGEYLVSVAKKKVAMRSGETYIAEIIDDVRLLRISKKLARLSKHPANLDVDCFFVNNRFYILELNCRFGGQYPFSHLAGVDFPKAIIQMLYNKPVADELLKVHLGIIGVKDIYPTRLK